ncbi:arylesterase [Pedobacter africanus]|uniref:Acyl-CoA thioesterase-1 n=1 Tax=Pedobacter africanus TaxID=151894 RepID=A0A1W2E4I7_9SPHI|nr:arylesterase [Pedobacter africanus]SMD03948.1 acyl-CoA thioesterase-1 [Pedobacter africanus]
MSSIILLGMLSACGNSQNSDKTAAIAKAKPAEAAPMATDINGKIQNILFFGTSLTAGYGLDPAEAYPALIQKKIDSLDLPYKVINGGLSGETSAAGKSRIDWLLKQPIAVFVLELGANDGLRGLSVTETSANLQAVIDKVKAKYPNVKMVMAGMQMPPNMGEKYTADFKAVFSNLAQKNQMVFVPFLLEGVGGVARLNQEDGIHPTAEGQQILAENVWKKLKAEL